MFKPLKIENRTTHYYSNSLNPFAGVILFIRKGIVGYPNLIRIVCGEVTHRTIPTKLRVYYLKLHPTKIIPVIETRTFLHQ